MKPGKRRGLSRILATLALVATSAPTVGAPTPPPPAMTFRLVRAASPACAPNCPEWIDAEGAIVQGTARSFRAFLAKLDRRRRPVLIQSGGGSIEDALDMARVIRASGLAVAVARTIPAPGARSDAPPFEGSAVSYPAYCFSACTFVLAAGVERYANPFAAIGVHQTIEKLSQVVVHRRFLVHYQVVNGHKQEISRDTISEDRKTIASTQVSPPGVNARLGAFFQEMGEDPSIVTLMQSATPQEIHVMSNAELEATRLVTVWINQRSAMDTARDDNGLAGLPTRMEFGDRAVVSAAQTWKLPPASDGRAREFNLELGMRRGGGSVTTTFSRPDGAGGLRFALAPGPSDEGRTTHSYPAAAFCHLMKVGVVEIRDAPSQTPTQAPGQSDPRAPLLEHRFAEIEGVRRLSDELCGLATATRN